MASEGVTSEPMAELSLRSTCQVSKSHAKKSNRDRKVRVTQCAGTVLDIKNLPLRTDVVTPDLSKGELWDLDLEGTADMVAHLLVTVGGKSIVRTPDGRCCDLCPYRDDQWDPMYLYCYGIKVYMLWGKPVLPSGKTSGGRCYYCCKWVNCRVKKSCYDGVTSDQYEVYLGHSPERLERHQKNIQYMVWDIIRRGGQLSGHINWEALDNTVTLSLENNARQRVIEPTMAWLELGNGDYEAEHPGGLTDERRREGHQLYVHNGRRGVKFPETKRVRFENSTERSVRQKTDIGTSGAQDSLYDAKGLQAQFAAIAGSLGRGSAGHTVAKALDNILEPTTDTQDGASASVVDGGDSSESLGGSGATGQGESNGTLKEAPKPRGKTVTKGKAKAKAASKPSSTESTTPKASPAKSINSDGRGRPKKDWLKEVELELAMFAASPKEDPIYWGSEARTKVKELEKKTTDIKNRLRATNDIDEDRQLKYCIKCIGIEKSMIGVVSDHGLESKEFEKTFDLQVASMELPPKCDVKFPAHLKQSRYAKDIASTEVVERWLHRCSSAQLRKNGIANVVEEQARQWSARLAGIWRLTDPKERSDQLAKVCDLEIDYDLENDVEGFVTAMATLLGIDAYDALTERIEFGGEALSILDKHVPNAKNGAAGTPLGATLANFPSASQWLADARLGVSRAKVSVQKLTPFGNLVIEFKSLVMSFSGAVLVAEPASVLAVSNALAAIAKSHRDDLNEVISSFVPAREAPELHVPTSAWVEKVWSAFIDTLKPLMKSATTSDVLEHWSSSTKAKRPLLQQAATSIFNASNVVSESTALANLRKADSMVAWFASVNAFMCSSDRENQFTLDELKNIQREFKLHFTNFDVPEVTLDSDDHSSFECNAVCSLLQSPLFRIGEGYPLAMKSILSDKGNAAVKGAKDFFTKVFTSFPLLLIQMEERDPIDLARISDMELDTDAIQAAMKWATDTHDNLLLLQLQLIVAALHVFRACASAQRCTARYFASGMNLQKRKVNDTQLERLKDLRQRFQQWEKLADNNSHVFDSDITSKEPLHCGEFDNMLDIKSIVASASAEVHRLENLFKHSWARDVQCLHDAIDELVPKWYHIKATLLTHAPVVERLLNLPDTGYNAIGPLCGELKSILKAIRSVHGQPLVDARLMIRAGEICDQGVETVAHAFVIKHTHREWLKLSSPAEAAIAVETLQTAVKRTGVVLSEQLEKELEAWKSGAKLTELAEATSSEQKSTSVDQVPRMESKAFVVADGSSPHASVSAPKDVASPGTAPGVSAEVPSKSLSLRERAAAAKRRRVEE